MNNRGPVYNLNTGKLDFPLDDRVAIGTDGKISYRIGATSEGYFLALSYPMDDFGWSHPLILAEGDLPYEDVEQVIRGVCEEGKSTGDIPVVMEKLKDCTGEAFGED